LVHRKERINVLGQGREETAHIMMAPGDHIMIPPGDHIMIPPGKDGSSAATLVSRLNPRPIAWTSPVSGLDSRAPTQIFFGPIRDSIQPSSFSSDPTGTAFWRVVFTCCAYGVWWVVGGEVINNSKFGYSSSVRNSLIRL
jgi:hypothetical protein